MAKKNAIWAEQLTPEQLEQFKDNIRKYSCSGATYDEYMVRSSESFYDFIAYSFNWHKTEQKEFYWNDVANGKMPMEPLNLFVDKSNEIQSTLDTNEKMRDEIALEAMKVLLRDIAPLTSRELGKIGIESYDIADAMIEARKPKIEA